MDISRQPVTAGQQRPAQAGSDSTQAQSNHIAADITNELEQWKVATETLRKLLAVSSGVVSSKALCRELEKCGIANTQQMNTKLKLFKFDDPESEPLLPSFRYVHRGRSFYSEEASRKADNEIEAAAERDGQGEQELEYEQVEIHAKKKNRKEEARLGGYVAEALEDIYATDKGPENRPIVFDIHNERPGTEFENVDLLAVHWRSREFVELVAVEVKLYFSPRLVLQALNYQRFAHRVWVAVPVSTDMPANELREVDAQLFDYIIEHGIGILACRKRKGGKYEVSPIHWPSLNRLDHVETAGFIERYREKFEEAQAVEPKQSNYAPKLR